MHDQDLHATIVRRHEGRIIGARPAWNAAQLAYLHREWLDGTTTAEIGRRCTIDFGIRFNDAVVPVTKNAVIGACHRNNFDQRVNPVVRQPRRLPCPLPEPRIAAPLPSLPPLSLVPRVCLAPSPEPFRMRAPTPIATPPPAPVARPASFLRPPMPASPVAQRCVAASQPFTGRRRDDTGCRWPIGDPRDRGSFRLCDANIAGRDDAYCQRHSADAFMRVRDRD